MQPHSLTELLKKSAQWDWCSEQQNKFETLKKQVASEPILRLPNFRQPFEVHTDILDRAIIGVLVQEGHLIAFESRKLNNA